MQTSHIGNKKKYKQKKPYHTLTIEHWSKFHCDHKAIIIFSSEAIVNIGITIESYDLESTKCSIIDIVPLIL